MKWNTLTSPDQLDQVNKISETLPVLILKHSTRCSISSAALSRLERQWQEDATTLQPYYLDLIKHRDVSDAIAARYNVPHESPQILIIKNGQCVFSQSHMDINFNSIAEHA